MNTISVLDGLKAHIVHTPNYLRAQGLNEMEIYHRLDISIFP